MLGRTKSGGEASPAVGGQRHEALTSVVLVATTPKRSLGLDRVKQRDEVSGVDTELPSQLSLWGDRAHRPTGRSSAPSRRSTRRRMASDEAYVESIPKNDRPRAPSVRACVYGVSEA